MTATALRLASLAALLAAQQLAQAAALDLGAIRPCGAAANASTASLTAYVNVLSAPLGGHPRQEPPASPPLPQLKFGARVQVICRLGERVQVAASGDGAQLGWLRWRLLRRDAPVLAAVLREYDTLPVRNTRQRLDAARRAVALAPLDLGARARLVQALAASGDKPAADAARARLEEMRSMAVVRLPGEPQALLVKDGELVRPLAQVLEGRLAPLLPTPEAAAAFADPGRVYYRYGGGQSGKVMLAGARELACSDGAIAAQAAEGAPENAILANTPPSRAASATPRAVTPAERSSLAAMAKQVMARVRLPPHYILQMVGRDGPQLRRQFVALPVPGNTRPLLYAAYALDYVLEGRSGTVALTILAEPNDSGAYLAVFKDVDQGDSAAGGAFRKFVVNADLDGDGREELVLAAQGHGGMRHEVLARGRGRWTIALATPPGC